MTLLPVIEPPEATLVDLARQASDELSRAIQHIDAAICILDDIGWSDDYKRWHRLCNAATVIENTVKELGVAR